ncbi:protein of unknown function [Cupriavidus neocaledonicus]|uniref:Uncharacterized protein n=1 Tax=Cupriavidus neocaledonicus TaxID=1040979 RepID=A0A375H540_9BURK|nr:hypothetical protein CBM2605_A140063 [Cupriavidus neocaledonicus]SPD46802.1 protein of unknown function [Cupriavidus neocaledonicus]
MFRQAYMLEPLPLLPGRAKPERSIRRQVMIDRTPSAVGSQAFPSRGQCQRMLPTNCNQGVRA